jgi:hypothetical protein
MSLVTNISNVVTRIATQFKAVDARTGVLANLQTTDKSSLVSAINEARQLAANATGGGPATPINDTTPSTTSVYSSSRTETRILEVATAQANAALATLTNGAPTTLDSFKEVADWIATDQSGAAAMTASINQKVSFAEAQTLTSLQKTQARTNIDAVGVSDVGDTSVNFVTTFEAALA